MNLFLRYEVLSDSEKRGIYDARGEAGLSESGGMGGVDPQVRSLERSKRKKFNANTYSQDLLSQLFSGGGGFGGGGFFGGGGGPRGGPRKTKDLVHRVHVTLEDLSCGNND